MDDDLPPLISDAELSDSDDDSSLPELQQSGGSDCDAGGHKPTNNSGLILFAQSKVGCLSRC